MAKFKLAASVCVLLAATAPSGAADFDVCQSIAGKAGTLVDKNDSEQWNQSVDSEFDHVCKDTERYESTLAGSSDATQASFGYAGFQLGYGNSASDVNSRTSKAIDAVCKTGKRYVSTYFHSVDTAVSARYAVQLVDDCLRILAQSDLEAFTGVTEVSTASNTAFFVQMDFKPSSSAPNRKYKLISIQSDPKADVKCTEQPNKDVVGSLIVEAQSKLSFTCTRTANVDTNGAFNFASEGDSTITRSLRFSVPSLSGHEMIREQIKKEIESEIDGKISALRPFLLPHGAIVAMNDPGGCTKLGEGWADAHLDGKFIQGANSETFRKTGGAPTYVLAGENIPEINLIWRHLNSGEVSGFRAVEGLVFGAAQDLDKSTPNVPQGAGQSQPKAIDTIPPYVSLYFCERS
ncbi:hypothetical protein FJ959_15660 [Mesorhizobium sp. B2-2-4]|uniref:hypothetical protein n=1 Tax=unclassified Mesorhizobium TaxID=325217 RepID=UPI0011297AA8|nr:MULTISPECIES: hypothetical protein [unclassified Mesorhizobium]TPM56494.1 hypothetical protein FJ959_15660 [Mesorhizobium sp. B2-2-4]TPM68540.1 hypothetical protein FJ965_08900 [Mesorhizobium sp. B2-2-1]TPN71605.1 hypothetical protein FJ984_06775 [Mesorhizobium sp. B1-1-3]